MPLIPEKKLIFVHIPKTAGTFIYKTLKFAPVNQKLHFFHTDKQFEYAHATARMIKSQKPLEYKNYWKFTLVRNPYERMLSEFFYKKKYKDHRVVDCSRIDFGKFVSYVFHNYDKIMAMPHAVKSHFLGQHDFILPDVEIYQQENIQTLTDKLKAKYAVDIPNDRPLATHHRAFQEYYNQEIREMVESIYYTDLKLFNYKFEGA